MKQFSKFLLQIPTFPRLHSHTNPTFSSVVSTKRLKSIAAISRDDCSWNRYREREREKSACVYQARCVVIIISFWKSIRFPYNCVMYTYFFLLHIGIQCIHKSIFTLCNKSCWEKQIKMHLSFTSRML